MANNAVADWWNARADARLTDVVTTSGSTSFTIECSWPSGVIVKMQVGSSSVAEVLYDNKPTQHEIKREFGCDWLYIVVPCGRHQIQANFHDKDAVL